MTYEVRSAQEVEPKIVQSPPIIESFIDPNQAAKFWPEDIVKDKAFLAQIETRAELRKNLMTILDRLPRPDISLEEAIGQQKITEEQLEKLYTSLSSLLEDHDYQRIALYLPFEFLPNKDWQPKEKKLQEATNRFKETYMKAWKELFSFYDVRANFVDGDIREAELESGNLPRVVKAAHLIPKLLEKGLLEIKEVIKLIEESDDQILKNSIADALPVLADLGYLGESEIQTMEKSNDRLVINMARIIGVQRQKTEKVKEEWAQKIITHSTVKEELSKKLSQLENEDYSGLNEKRKEWLQEKRKQEAIEMVGEDIGTALGENKISKEEIDEFLNNEANIISQQALIEGVRKAIESIEDQEKAKLLFEQHKESLLMLWGKNNPELRESLAKTFRRFSQLNIISDSQLKSLNIVQPKLAGPFSENIKSMGREMQEVREMIALIEANPELSKFLYPTVLVYGSRLKGYGQQKADIDLGVFVRPEISFNDRKKMQALLKENFSHEKVQGEVTEFWLEEKDGKLEIRKFKEEDLKIGKERWAHILLGAAWEGDKESIRELQEKLLVSYMRESDKKIHSREARRVYLEELERDTLQYRLMHKGYEQFYPPYGGMHTEHADEIDGESMFWDSGYRQLAIKLFVDRVFLPKISAQEK